MSQIIKMIACILFLLVCLVASEDACLPAKDKYHYLGEGVLISKDARLFLYMEKYAFLDNNGSVDKVSRICSAIGPNCVGFSMYDNDLNHFVLVYQNESLATRLPLGYPVKIMWVPQPGDSNPNTDFHSDQEPNDHIASAAAYKEWFGWSAYIKEQ